jgi:hypothetical protein
VDGRYVKRKGTYLEDNIKTVYSLVAGTMHRRDEDRGTGHHRKTISINADGLGLQAIRTTMITTSMR